MDLPLPVKTRQWRCHVYWFHYIQNTYPTGILKYARACEAAPPWSTTVAITISEVVVNMACRASDTVLRIANANDIAPRRPENSLIN